MKQYGLIPFRRIRLACVFLVLAFQSLALQFTTAGAQSPTVTAPSVDIPHTLSYQGTLADKSGKLLDSVSIPMVVSLYSDDQGMNRIWQGTYTPTVSRGVFSIQLGSGNYPLPKGDAIGRAMWLGIAVGGSPELRPLTPVAASAYALNVADNSITAPKMGTDYVSSVQINGQQVTSRGGAANFLPGQGISMSYDSTAQGILINTQQIQSPTANTYGSNWWGELGNNSLAVGSYLGTSDNEALEIHVNNGGAPGGGDQRVMLYSPEANSPSIIGGFSGNSFPAGTDGATIAGGGYSGNVNSVTGSYAFVGGGYNNTANQRSFVGGGAGNAAVGGWDVVTGGEQNTVASGSAVSAWVTISGGGNNSSLLGTAPNYACYATIGGGAGNEVGALAATVGGGGGNTIGAVYENGNEQFATIAGGSGNGINNAHGTSGYSVNYATIGGGTANGITTGSLSSGESSTISGGKQNSIAGTYSAIPGGEYLTLGNNSFGFNGDNSGTGTNTIPNLGDNIAYFGNVNLILGNVDGIARQLRFYQANGSATYAGTNYTSFQAPTSFVGHVDVNYVLPNQQGAANTVLTNNGSGALFWGPIGLLAWALLGNTGTVDGTNFLGTVDNVALTFRTDNFQALRIEPNSTSPNIIGGYLPAGSSGNLVGSGHGDVIAGGGQSGAENKISANYGFIGGGTTNQIKLGTSPGTSDYGVIAGGFSNTINANVTGNEPTDYGFIGGGAKNTIEYSRVGGHRDNTEYATIGGGLADTVIESWTFVGGGYDNKAFEEGAAVAGGESNFALQPFAVIAGGDSNVANDYASFIGGGWENVIGSRGANNSFSYNAIVGGDTNIISSATYTAIGGGSHNLIASSSPHTYIATGANIPGGMYLTAQSYAQTVVGFYNIASGTSNSSFADAFGHVNNPNDRVFIIGNGNGIPADPNQYHNAFEVSNSGYSTVYNNTGAGSPSIAVPPLPATRGGTHNDNVVYAWGDVTVIGGVSAWKDGYGVNSAIPPIVGNRILVILNLADEYGVAIAGLSYISVTATVNTGNDPGCATIAATPIYSAGISNSFYVWTHISTDATCTNVPLGFSFKVTGRP